MATTLRALLADARARARFESDTLGHDIGAFIRPPFVPTGRPDNRARAFCRRCPADVTVDVVPAGASIRSGSAIVDVCTGVTRATVDGRTVASTTSHCDRYVNVWAAHWRDQYPGQTVDVAYPTTGPDARQASERPGGQS